MDEALRKALREDVGRMVREEWVAWAREQPGPEPSWLRAWGELTEPEREGDRRIGERLFFDGVRYADGTARARAWDALVRLLPRLGEWERGSALAADGRLLEWVLRQAADCGGPMGADECGPVTLTPAQVRVLRALLATDATLHEYQRDRALRLAGATPADLAALLAALRLVVRRGVVDEA